MKELYGGQLDMPELSRMKAVLQICDDNDLGTDSVKMCIRDSGYLEGNGWRVSWCVGHLAGLADADSYDPKYAKWRYRCV